MTTSKLYYMLLPRCNLPVKSLFQHGIMGLLQRHFLFALDRSTLRWSEQKVNLLDTVSPIVVWLSDQICTEAFNVIP